MRKCDAAECLRAGTGTVELAPLRAGTVICYEGTLLHKGTGHHLSAPRRVLYFSARYLGETGNRLGEAALHPSLRCMPLRDSPLLPLAPFTLEQFNLSYAQGGQSQEWWSRHCGSMATTYEAPLSKKAGEY